MDDETPDLRDVEAQPVRRVIVLTYRLVHIPLPGRARELRL